MDTTIVVVDLFASRMNYYSQNGEDGIIEAMLAELQIPKGFFVEFGAWDGKHWSNTYNLIGKQWSGCLIEADTRKFSELCRTVPDDNIIKINALIEPAGPNSLEELLRRHGVGHVDLLSIDIDSDDLAIWESLTWYSPTVVIIEFNPTIPFDTRYRNPSRAFHGNSALSIYEFAVKRSYVLVAGTDTNLIFVRRDAWVKTSIPARTLQEVRDNTFQLRFFFSQDGALLHTYEPFIKAGVTELFPVPWIFTVAAQPVPRLLRRRSDRINPAAVAFSLLVAAIRCPLQLLRLVVYTTGAVTNGRSAAESLSLLIKKGKLTSLLKR